MDKNEIIIKIDEEKIINYGDSLQVYEEEISLIKKIIIWLAFWSNPKPVLYKIN